MSKKIYRKSTQTIDGSQVVARDPIAVRTEEADWVQVQKKPLGYNESRDSIEPIKKIEVDEIDVTARLGVTHNADIGGKLTAHEAVFGDDVAIHGDLYVEGTTTTTNEAQVSTSGDYIVTRENNSSVMSNTDHSGLVVNNYANNKLGAITIKSDGTWRVSADTSSSSSTFTDIVSFNGKYYNGLTDTLLDPQPVLNILTNVVAGELPHCVIYDHHFYHYDGSEWKGPEEWDDEVHALKANVVQDPDVISALEAIQVYSDLVYYESVTSSTISVGAEQPILTREEEENISDSGILKYNKTTNRAEDIAIPTVDDTALFAQVNGQGINYLWKKVAGVVWVNALPVNPNILTNLYVYTDANGKVTYHVGNADTQTLLEMKMDAIEYVNTLPMGNAISNKVYAIRNATDSSESLFYFGFRDESDPTQSELIALDSKAVIWLDAVPQSNIQDKVYVVGKRVYVGSKASSKVQEVGTPWFYGTQAEWNALSATEKAEYEYVVLSDDFSAANIVVDKIENGNLNAVSSNAVYESLTPIDTSLKQKADYFYYQENNNADNASFVTGLCTALRTKNAGKVTSYPIIALNNGRYWVGGVLSCSGNDVIAGHLSLGRTLYRVYSTISSTTVVQMQDIITFTTGSKTFTAAGGISGTFRWLMYGRLVILNIQATSTTGGNGGGVTIPSEIAPNVSQEGMKCVFNWDNDVTGYAYFSSTSSIYVAIHEAGKSGSGQIVYIH